MMMSIGEVENKNGHPGIKSLLRIYHTCKLTRGRLQIYNILGIDMDNVCVVYCSQIRGLVTFWCVANPFSSAPSRSAVSTVCT